MTTATTDHGVLWAHPLERRGGLLVTQSRTAPAGASDASTEQAVREVYDAHFPRLAGWATRLVSDPDLGHDFATEAFVKLIGHWGTVDEPRAWLYATVANQVRDHWRKRGREATAYRKVQGGRRTAEYDPGNSAHRGTRVTFDVSPEPAVDHATTLTVRSAVQALPERLRIAVLLHYFADLPVAAVAAQLGKSEGTIKRDLYDARNRIAHLLEDIR